MGRWISSQKRHHLSGAKCPRRMGNCRSRGTLCTFAGKSSATATSTPWSSWRPFLDFPRAASAAVQDWQVEWPENRQNLLRRIRLDAEPRTVGEGADLRRPRGIFPYAGISTTVTGERDQAWRIHFSDDLTAMCCSHKINISNLISCVNEGETDITRHRWRRSGSIWSD